MAIYFVAFACLLAATLSGAQQIAPGKCNATVQSTFDMSKYTGVWYPLSHIPNPFEQGDTCARAIITQLDKNLLHFNESAVRQPGSKYVVQQSNASAPNISEPAKLVEKGDVNPVPAPYWILETDYSTYSVVYSCEQVANFKLEFAWVVARATSINGDIQKRVQAVFARNGISMKGLRPIIRKNCPY